MAFNEGVLPYAWRAVDESLVLRQQLPADAERITQLMRGNEAEMRRWFTWMPAKIHADERRDYINETGGRWAAGKEFAWGMDVDGELAGHISLILDRSTPEIGYWLGAEYKGRGLMPKAVRAVTNLALSEMGKDVVIIKANAHNAASNRVAEKAGYINAYTLGGSLSQTNVWVMAQAMWLPEQQEAAA